MRNFKLGLALVVTTGLSLSAACSSDDDSGASGGGNGATAKGGNTSGGATSKGGSGGASGGSASKGGNTSGGTPNAGGEPGAGGGATNPGDCPEDPPTEGETCDVDVPFGDGCEYGGTTCACDEPFGGGDGGGSGQTEWICFGDGGGGAPGGGGGAPGGDGGAPGGGGAGASECPPGDQPSGDCTGPIEGCDYDGVMCECPAFGPDEDTWVCE